MYTCLTLAGAQNYGFLGTNNWCKTELFSCANLGIRQQSCRWLSELYSNPPLWPNLIRS